ncbi:MAG: hypothetical protein WC517_02190 [Patescibacteria group bacterium]
MGRLHLYRNISITFIIFAAMILCAVFLLFYSQATIIVTPDAQILNLNFVTEIRPSSTPSEIAKLNSVGGAIRTEIKTVEAPFNTSSTRSATDDGLVGKVKLINSYSKPQKLVKTTQLQAANGVIVRTNNDVDIPAGGSVEVDVYPKDAASFSSISPGKLVIIKLWPQLQPLIYGEAVEMLEKSTGGEVRFIAESDINYAKRELVARALAETVIEASGTRPVLKGDLVSYGLDKKLGDEANIFNMKAVVSVKIITANEAQLAELIRDRASKMDLKGLSASSIDMSQAKYVIMDASNPESIVIKVSYPVRAYLTEASGLLAKNNFTGRTKNEITDYAAKAGIIKNIEVIISPYWRDQTPDNEKSIKVIIK